MLTVTITSEPNSPYRHELKARNHTIVADVAADLNGGDTGATPHEMLLMAVGTCGAMTMKMFAEKNGIPVTKVTCTVTEDTIADPDDAAKQIPHIVEKYEVEGNVTADQLATLGRIAKKCPVAKLLTGKKVLDATVSIAAAAVATP